MGSRRNVPELRGPRSTPEQKAHIINYMYSHRAFAHGQFRGPLGAGSLKKEWKNLTAEVNNVGGGPKKTVVTWKKTWADIKRRTKAKAMALISERNRTGRFPEGDDVLNMLERKVLAVMGRVAIEGIPGTKDSMPESEAALIGLMSGHRRVFDEEDPVSLFETYNIDADLMDEPVNATARQPAQTRKKKYPASTRPSYAGPESKKIRLQELTSRNTTMLELHREQTMAQGSRVGQSEPVEVERATAEKRQSERLELQGIVADFENVVDWTDTDD